MNCPLKWSACLLALTCSCLQAEEAELYFTDFEDATPGDDQLVSFDSWAGTSIGRGSHGIDEAAVEGIGQSAFLGFNSPGATTTSVRVLRPVAHDPDATGQPFLRFTAIIGINDSDNSVFPGQEPPRDSFFIDFINSSGTRLASLNYNNTEAGFGLWRDDGVGVEDTGEEFIRGELQLLFAEIDLANNTWSVELDGFAIFRDAEFTATVGTALDLAAVGATWQRAAFQWGNNWMLFDDWTVSADSIKLVIPEEPFKIVSVGRDSANGALLTWRAQPRFSYQVEYSDDLVTWRSDLPDSVKTEPVEQNTSYTDQTAPSAAKRAYRVVRTELP